MSIVYEHVYHATVILSAKYLKMTAENRNKPNWHNHTNRVVLNNFDHSLTKITFE